jgi:hypothetical protein
LRGWRTRLSIAGSRLAAACAMLYARISLFAVLGRGASQIKVNATNNKWLVVDRAVPWVPKGRLAVSKPGRWNNVGLRLVKE